MRRSVCYCEPGSAFAGERRTWKFVYTPSLNLPKGTKLKFDIQSRGRAIDWEVPSTNLKKSGCAIFALLNNGKVLPATAIELPDQFVPQFEFILPSPLEAGEPFTIVLGDKEPDSKDASCGLRAQTTSQRRRSFLLYIDPTGKGRYEDPEIFNIDIKGNELAVIRILNPSFVTKNKRFDVVVRFEDAFGNLTNHAPEDTLVELSHEHLRENLNWKLFVPETGFITLPNLYFNEEGIYTIFLSMNNRKQTFRSFPIRCFSDCSHHLYWGLFHGESDRYDSTDNIENCLRHFRDEKAFHFYGVSPFESQEETSNEVWKSVTQNIVDFNENDRFVTFLGFQWQGENSTEGSRLILFSKEGKSILRKKDIKNSSLKKIYKNFAPKEILSIPTFTMAQGNAYDFENFDPEFERVVEIYNAWGSSETTKKEGNPIPILSTNGFLEDSNGTVQKALQKNCRFGFVGGGLDDRGFYSSLFESDQEQYPAGLTGIIAAGHTREAFFEALYKRSCYATTGERIILGFTLAGIPMGQEVSTADKPGLTINRHLSGYVAGTSKLAVVEIIRNGKVIKTFEPSGYAIDFTWDDMTSLEKIALPSPDKRPPFAYYYLRVTQEDGHMAWSSPIWVDYIPLSEIQRIQKLKQSKPPVKEDKFDIDNEDDEDDFDDYEDEE